MNLKHLDSDIDFVVTPAAFLGIFDVYDREETWGAYLDQFDPNNPKELNDLLEKYFFNNKRILRFTVDHKIEMIKVLINALNDKKFNFGALLVNDEDPYDTFSLPSTWEFTRPRFYFEEVYKLAYKYWGNDLKEAGFNIPNVEDII